MSTICHASAPTRLGGVAAGLRRFACLFSLALPPLAAPRLTAAQVTERAIAFDSAGRLLTVTSELATRLGLAPPRWPVTGAFVDARLVTADDTSAVLVVRRDALRTERYALSPASLRDIRDAFAEAMRTRRGVAEDDGSGIVLEDAARQFARGQKFLASFVYGPAVSAMIDNPKTASAMYAVIAGGSYFAFDAFADNHRVTRAQAELATDGGYRGAAMAILALAAADNDSHVTGGAGVLAGSILGSVAGYRRAQALRRPRPRRPPRHRPFWGSPQRASWRRRARSTRRRAGVRLSFRSSARWRPVGEWARGIRGGRTTVSRPAMCGW
jgi:hypothetical protein